MNDMDVAICFRSRNEVDTYVSQNSSICVWRAFVNVLKYKAAEDILELFWHTFYLKLGTLQYSLSETEQSYCTLLSIPLSV